MSPFVVGLCALAVTLVLYGIFWLLNKVIAGLSWLSVAVVNVVASPESWMAVPLLILLAVLAWLWKSPSGKY